MWLARGLRARRCPLKTIFFYFLFFYFIPLVSTYTFFYPLILRCVCVCVCVDAWCVTIPCVRHRILSFYLPPTAIQRMHACIHTHLTEIKFMTWIKIEKTSLGGCNRLPHDFVEKPSYDFDGPSLACWYPFPPFKLYMDVNMCRYGMYICISSCLKARERLLWHLCYTNFLSPPW